MKPYDNAEALDIEYCDNHVLAAVKPAGLLTQPDNSGDESLEAIVKEWVKKEFEKAGNVFLHCIHRLDRPVSGLVLFARTSKALSRLNEQSRSLEIQRTYIAEVEGVLPEKLGRLDHYLIHGDHKAIIAKEGDKDAKHARLAYEVLHYLTNTTIVSIQLETGRYHQIRAQFMAVGHPLAGDRRYGAKTGDGSAVHLHCAQIAFKHPVTNEIVTLESAPPFV